ncbi:MAG TPA: hypothetical protein VJ715_11655 [Pyrinomonadaceae bacterium]|nr:hypothetical protein [Pyrinomonadaceae bacterium]
MKAQKLTRIALALLIIATCISAFSQDTPLPAREKMTTQAVTKNPRAGYTPLNDGAKQSGASKAAALASTEAATTSSAAAYKTFTSGAGDTLFKWTISTHGNLVRLESPAGFEHLASGSVGEGYVVSMSTSIGAVRYFDAGFSEATGCSGNVRSWSPTVFETGATANGTTLIRDTCDGAWRLTQTFLRNPANHELTVTMTLRNLTAFNYTGVVIDRYFDGDLDNDNSDDSFSRTFDSVAGRDGILDNLSMTAISFDIPHSTAIHSFAGWNPSVTNQASLASPTGSGDFVGRVSYSLGTINASAQKVVKVLYKRQ